MVAAFSRLPLPLPAVVIGVALIIASLSQLKTGVCNGIDGDIVDRSLSINHQRHRRLHSHPLNIHHDVPNPWVTGVVTWYGSPEGAGSDGGACGYKSTVSQPPFNSLIAAGSNAIYLSGKGCGACYKVKCKSNANKLCSGRSIKVVITDQAPEDSTGQAHFDLSGTAFGALALPGHAAELRNAGTFQLQYKRVSCGFKTSVTFRVGEGSNPYYMALLVEFENGKHDITKVELRENHAKEWKNMTRSWGAMYQYSSVTGKPICFPLSVRVTEASGQTFKAKDVIPMSGSVTQATPTIEISKVYIICS